MDASNSLPACVQNEIEIFEVMLSKFFEILGARPPFWISALTQTVLDMGVGNVDGSKFIAPGRIKRGLTVTAKQR
jgi:hypothetical protein